MASHASLQYFLDVTVHEHTGRAHFFPSPAMPTSYHNFKVTTSFEVHLDQKIPSTN